MEAVRLVTRLRRRETPVILIGILLPYPKFDDHFGFFLPLAGISTVRHRKVAKIRNWANAFPYMNGGLSSGSADVPVGTANEKANEEALNDLSLTPHSQANEGVGVPSVPRFSKIARSYLLHVGELDWTKINPDIFSSMIQAVADDEERGSLGMPTPV